MTRRTRIIRNILIGVGSFVLLLVAAGFIASKIVRNKFDEALGHSGIKVSSLGIDFIRMSITLRDVQWTNPKDSRQTPQVTVKKVFAGRIDVIQFIREKTIHINSLEIEDGDVLYNVARQVPKDSTEAKDSTAIRKTPFRGLKIDRIALSNIALKIFNDSLLESTATGNMDIHEVELKDATRAMDIASYTFGSLDSRLSKITHNTSKSMYKLAVGAITISHTGEISIDSITLLPKYSKYKFSRLVGRQIDRFILLAPKVSISGLDFNSIKDSLFRASKLEISNTNLHVYRDKRLPFIRDHNLPLPMAMIKTLPFGLALDSIKIVDATITYQEFPEKGFETGAIVFEKLNATIDHFTNRDLYPERKEAMLSVTSRVMGNGVIKVKFSLPYGKAQLYNAQGTITNLSLYRLNPMLESLAFISVESGRLNQLEFNFDYNDVSSKGNLVINYENLKLKGLQKEKNPGKSEFKTWLLNVFLRKDKDATIPREKRTGDIDFQRDRRKAIFNVWVGSLFSGIKSSIIDSKSKKEAEQTPKERRDSLKKVDRKGRQEKKSAVQKEKVV